MEQIPEYINMLGYLFVVVYMFSVPLESTRGEIIGHFKNFKPDGTCPAGQLCHHSRTWLHHRAIS